MSLPNNKNNQPAFPVALSSFDGQQAGADKWTYPGVTIRDYFAIRALQAILSTNTGNCTCNDLAKDAYMYADAMITEREIK